MDLTNYIYSLMTDRRHGPFSVVVKALLWFLSLGYALIAAVTRTFYVWKILPVYRAAKPVISVGNITVGGAGKTPLVIAVTQILLTRQLRVGILSRGHRPKGADFSDETRMLQEHLPTVPVFTGADRRKSIEEALKHHAIDVFVCDDAFQHWPLHRDLDIVAVNANNPFGNGHLLPRGTLREPVSALKRAELVVLTKADAAQAKAQEVRASVEKLAPQALIVASRHVCVGCADVYQKTVYDPYHLKGISVVGFCAIADPNSFRQSLSEAGFNLNNLFVFMDHHAYTEKDMAMVRRWAQDHNVQIIMTTHKDAVKIAGFEDFWRGFKVYYLQVELEITHGKNVFIERIISAVGH